MTYAELAATDAGLPIAAPGVETPKTRIETVLDRTICVSVESSKWGIIRQANKASIETTADKDRLRLGMALIDLPEYDAIVRLDREIVNYLNMMAVPSFMKRSAHLIPIESVEAVEGRLRKFAERRPELVELLIEKIPEAKEEAREALGPLFDSTKYPSADELRSKFSLRWSYLDFGVPGKLRSISAKIFDAETDKARGRILEAESKIHEWLTLGYAKLVNAMVERLTPGVDGKPKIFRDSLVTNLTEFLNTIDVRAAAVGAKELTALSKKAKNLLSGVDPKTLRDNEALRENTRRGFAEVAETLGELVVTAERGTRRIVLPESSS